MAPKAAKPSNTGAKTTKESDQKLGTFDIPDFLA